MTHLFQSSRPYKKSLSFFIIKELSINQDHNRWNSTSSIIKALVEMNLLQSSRNNPLQDFSHHKIIWNPTSSRHYWKRPSSFNHQDQKNHVPSSLFNIQFLLQSSNNTNDQDHSHPPSINKTRNNFPSQLRPCLHPILTWQRLQ